jgi:hypothetical protein
MDKSPKTGTLTGTIWKPNVGRKLDGSDDKISFGNTGLLIGALEYWWKPTSPITTASPSIAVMRLTASGDQGCGIVSGACTGLVADETLTLLDNGGGRRTCVQNYNFNARHYHIVWNWSASDARYNLYVDSVLQTVVAPIAGHIAQMTASDLQIGLRETSGSTFSPDTFGEVRLHSVLTATQVKRYYEDSKWRYKNAN